MDEKGKVILGKKIDDASVTRSRVQEIVSLFESVSNRGAKHRCEYSLDSFDIEVNSITVIAMDTFFCGDIDFFTINIPSRLVESSNAEVVKWFEKRIDQLKLQEKFDILVDRLNSEKDEEKDLLDAFRNLNDPEWIHAKIVEINSLINDNNTKTRRTNEDLDNIKSSLDKEFEMSRSDGFIRLPKNRVSSIRFFKQGTWRDVCSSTSNRNE